MIISMLDCDCENLHIRAVMALVSLSVRVSVLVHARVFICTGICVFVGACISVFMRVSVSLSGCVWEGPHPITVVPACVSPCPLATSVFPSPHLQLKAAAASRLHALLCPCGSPSLAQSRLPVSRQTVCVCALVHEHV